MDRRIVVGGRDEPEARAPERRRGALALAVVALAVAGALLILRRPPPIETEVVGEDAVAAPVTVETTVPPAPSERIEGFDQTLVIVDGQGRVLGQGPDAPTQEFRDLPPGSMSADSSGRWLASFAGDAGEPGALFAGTAERMLMVSPDAYGAVWHPFEPGRLAWVEPNGEGPWLVEGRIRPDLTVEATYLGPVPTFSYPVWWSQGGLVLQSSGAVLVLAPGGGSTVGIADEGILEPATLYWGILERDGERDFVNPLLREVAPVPWPAECTPAAGEPGRGRFVAVVCPEDLGGGRAGGGTLQIWQLDRDGAEEFTELVFEQRGFSPEVTPTWSRDGRFVAAASADRSWLLVLDLDPPGAGGPALEALPVETDVADQVLVSG